MTEHTLVQAILREFGARHDMRIWRQNTGAAVDKRGALVRFGVPGQADISGIMLPSGRRIEIEVKGPRGVQSADQRNWQAMIERFGGIYILARSIDDVARGLRTT